MNQKTKEQDWSGEKDKKFMRPSIGKSAIGYNTTVLELQGHINTLTNWRDKLTKYIGGFFFVNFLNDEQRTQLHTELKYVETNLFEFQKSLKTFI